MTEYKEQTNEQICIHVEKYTQRMSYTAQGLPEYIGIAFPGSATSAAVWQIRKLTYTGTNATAVLWCDGNNNFDNIWDNHPSLSYS